MWWKQAASDAEWFAASFAESTAGAWSLEHAAQSDDGDDATVECAARLCHTVASMRFDVEPHQVG